MTSTSSVGSIWPNVFFALIPWLHSGPVHSPIGMTRSLPVPQRSGGTLLVTTAAVLPPPFLVQEEPKGLCFAAGIRRTWVIGGREVTPHSQPFMASIQQENRHICGGFLLNRSAILNKNVKRIKLPPANTDLCPGRLCRIIGWGDISNYGTIPTELMEANVTIVERKACNESWQGHVSNGMVCAASTSAILRGFCSGDSGGPLVCGKKVQGIVSFNGKRCGDRWFPDVYTRIAKYIAWIRFVLQTF
ncbi:serine protease 57-like [Erythrolamprus reginae]|uniref:serine protease 57-like n=1 Tax=Erythrolamprus reginae TaxID=121349 RepID=UPI00396C8626